MAEISGVLNNLGSVGGAGGINGVNPGSQRPDKAGGPSFKDALRGTTPSVGNTGIAKEVQSRTLPPVKNLASEDLRSPLKFSNHAIERMRSRGISYSPETMARIEGAIDKAAAKGGKETLLLTDESALIVSVNNRTVVTVMDKQNLKENVFTNIDSTIVL
jgi:flagellar operon protein